MTTPTRVIAYARYSPRPERKPGKNGEIELDSVDKQIADLRNFCDKQGWPLEDRYIFEDRAVSGGDALDKRPGLLGALRALKPGAVLLVVNGDRLARHSGVTDYIATQVVARGATIYTLEGGAVDPSDPVSKFLFTILGAFAELQRKLIGTRSKAGRKRNLAAGKWRYRWLPYGYRWVDKQAGQCEPDPAEQAALQRIREHRDAGYNRAKIARLLNQEGIAWRDGKPWDRFAVRTAVNSLGRH